MKKYIVRANNYQYNDENFYIDSPGKIEGIFETKAEAQEALKAASIATIGLYDNLGDFLFNSGNEDEKAQQLRAYYQQNFRIKLDNTEPDLIAELYLPKGATDEQAFDIIQILHIKFYEVFEFEMTSPLLEIVYNPEFWGQVDYDPFTGEFGRAFYINEHEAMVFAAERFGNAIYDEVRGLKGGLDSLSDSPDLLQSFIKNSTNLQYADSAIKLKSNMYNITVEELSALNDLLKVKPFKLVPLSFEEAQENTGKEVVVWKTPTPRPESPAGSASDKKWWEVWKG